MTDAYQIPSIALRVNFAKVPSGCNVECQENINIENNHNPKKRNKKKKIKTSCPEHRPSQRLRRNESEQFSMTDAYQIPRITFKVCLIRGIGIGYRIVVPIPIPTELVLH